MGLSVQEVEFLMVFEGTEVKDLFGSLSVAPGRLSEEGGRQARSDGAGARGPCRQRAEV